MNFEEQLIKKQYYQNFINSNNQPMQTLGELYFEEQGKEDSDLSTIRYVQGELYFHYKDYEAAIFKWESIQNELEPWASKNRADAYVELGYFAQAEDLYTAIVTDSLILNTEIGLQLFSLYKRLGKQEKADNIIKWVVSLNPDYPTVTDTARTYYEVNEDWISAVELAVNEGKRTENIQWFTVLKSYVDHGFTTKLPSEYFEESLLIVKNINQPHFEQLLSSLWKKYEKTEDYLTWVKSLNHVFDQIERHEQDNWGETRILFKEVFFTLVGGRFYIKEIEDLVPDLLKNWTKIEESSNIALVYGAILAWNDYFPMTLNQSIVEQAESFISRESLLVNTVDESFNLLSDILKWGKEESIEIGQLLEWDGKSFMIEETDELSSVKMFLQSHSEDKRNEQLLLLIRTLLNSLLDKKEEQKNQLLNLINWNEEVLLKFNGASNQLDDLKFGKNKVIKKSFQVKKGEVKELIQSKVPEILKSCSDLVNEDRDFKSLQMEINNEMNERILLFLNETVMSLFSRKFNDWLKKAELEFNESELFISELREGLNLLFAEEKLQMDCDYQVLNDWKRDIERMTSYVSYENENIFIKVSPSQFLLKSAGKLLGSMSQNKGFLVNQYKKLIENEDYTEVAARIADKFLQQFNLFERTLERDIGMFFRKPIEALKQVLVEMEKEKESNNKELQSLKANPEKFYDPVILFQIRHRQFEWLNIGTVNI